MSIFIQRSKLGSLLPWPHLPSAHELIVLQCYPAYSKIESGAPTMLYIGLRALSALSFAAPTARLSMSANGMTQLCAVHRVLRRMSLRLAHHVKRQSPAFWGASVIAAGVMLIRRSGRNRDDRQQWRLSGRCEKCA
jgi:hypothetical protein